MTSESAGTSTAAPEANRSAGFDAGAVVNREFDDFDEMAAAAPRWSQEYIKLGHGNAGGDFQIGQTARMQLGRVIYRTGLLSQGLIPPHAIAFLACTGGSHMTHRGHRLTEGEVAILSNGSEFECFAHGPLNILALSLDEKYLRDQADVLAHADIFSTPSSTQRIRFVDIGYQRLLAAIGRMVTLTLSKPQLLTNPIAAKRMEDEIASLLVSAATSPTDDGAPWVRHRAAKRAMAYIRDNADELFTISELCKSIGASQRTLEIGFRELFGVPPKVYLTMLRLNLVRRDLRSAGPSHTSVTDVATQWGFFHFGRFAQAYQRFHGELPSVTLKKTGQPASATKADLYQETGIALRAFAR